MPDPIFFDSFKVELPKLRHLLRAKAVLCPGLRVSLSIEGKKEKAETENWLYEDGLQGYLLGSLDSEELIPQAPLTHHAEGIQEAVDWALVWVPERRDLISESYVNLIPTPLGGTHVNGLRAGLTEALREFCEFRDLLPRGLRLIADDLW